MADLDTRWLTEACDRLNSTLQTMGPSLDTIAEQLAVRPRPGRCGQPSPAGVLSDRREYCSLDAGHAGWHHAENGTEWSDPDPDAMRAEIDRLAQDRDLAIREARLSREATERAVSVLQNVRKLTLDNDGVQYFHTLHPASEGEAECPGCWAQDILNALQGGE